MKDVRSIDIDAVELVRGLARVDELRGRARLLSLKDIGRPLPEEMVRAVWAESEGLAADLPSSLVASPNALASVLARLLALPGVVTPITSLMRAWSITDCQNNLQYGNKPLGKFAVFGFVGLIAGELLATIGAGADLRRIGMDGARRTLSYVCAQAAIHGWRQDALATIVERWLEASTLTGSKVDASVAVAVGGIAGFLQALSDLGEVDDASLPHALARHVQLWVDAQVGAEQGDLLQRSLPQFSQAIAGLRREARFDAVTEALGSSNNIGHPLERGYLLSLIEPGSFDFLDLARRDDPATGAVAVAYCACAGVLGKETTLAKYSGFGWNLYNNGLRPGLETALDISIAELRVLHDSRRDAPITFRTRSPLLIDVELAPMVVGSFANGAGRKALALRTDERPDSEDREDLLLERVGAAIRSLEEAYSALAGRRPKQDRRAAPQRRPPK